MRLLVLSSRSQPCDERFGIARESRGSVSNRPAGVLRSACASPFDSPACCRVAVGGGPGGDRQRLLRVGDRERRLVRGAPTNEEKIAPLGIVVNGRPWSDLSPPRCWTAELIIGGLIAPHSSPGSTWSGCSAVRASSYRVDAFALFDPSADWSPANRLTLSAVQSSNTEALHLRVWSVRLGSLRKRDRME
jgi:hypothetical protein